MEPPRKKQRKAERDPTGALMQIYERATATWIDPNKPWIVRLDGHNFSSMMAGISKPYDLRYFEAMDKVATDLIEEFRPSFVYTQSDEISMVFPRARVNERGNTSECIYNGQVQKLASLTASFASVRFNHHMSRAAFSAREDKLRERMSAGTFTFDARVLNVPDEEAALQNILWRSNFDCRRNSIAALGFHHLKGSRTRLTSLSTRDILAQLRARGIQWSDTPARFRFGALVKKEMYVKEGVDPRTQETSKAMRTRVTIRSFRVPTNPMRGIPLLFAKYWDAFDEATKALEAQRALALGPDAAPIDDGDDDDGEESQVESVDHEEEGKEACEQTKSECEL